MRVTRSGGPVDHAAFFVSYEVDSFSTAFRTPCRPGIIAAAAEQTRQDLQAHD
jgi:hypothetical protein